MAMTSSFPVESVQYWKLPSNLKRLHFYYKIFWWERLQWKSSIFNPPATMTSWMEHWCYSFSARPSCSQWNTQSGYLIVPVAQDARHSESQSCLQFRYTERHLSTLTKRLEKRRLGVVEMSSEVLNAFSPWFWSSANTIIFLRPVSTTNIFSSCSFRWLQSEEVACFLVLQNCLQVKQIHILFQ